jgi:mono/diheme cytochrome c family protein
MLAAKTQYIAIASVLLVSSLGSQSLNAQPADFARDVRPIFEASCYSCHGSKLQSANLRFDIKPDNAALAKILVPGDATRSILFQRIAGLGDQVRMPLGGKPLSTAQITIIRNWIEQGAGWPEPGNPQLSEKKHWAFIVPVRATLPKASQPNWVRNPIDNFILAKLDTEKVKPSAEADRTTLLRRLSLDLIGLPPTPKEIDDFLSDRSPTAYDKQVDRLLKSPHYGEKWARTWLDAARYADSDGFEKDKQRSVWFYRDWVINALNRDLPYNQFIIDQIAGDLLPNATQDQIVATGFLRNSMVNEEGGIDPEQFRMEAMFDRMEAIGKGILGVTVQCAQCHNHKYDPIKQDDYYRMLAFLNSTHEANVAVYTPAEQMKRADIFRQIREIEGTLQHHNADWEDRMAQWESRVSAVPQWTVITPDVDDLSNGGQKYILQKDGSFLAAGYAPTKHSVKMTLKTDVQNITAFRLELLNDPNLPLSGPGRAINGGCALTEFEVEAAPATEGAKPVKVKFARATADFNPPEKELEAIFYDKTTRRRVTGPIDFAIDGKEETAWGIDAGPGRRNQPRNAVFLAEKPIANSGGTVLTIHLKQNHGGWNSDDNQSNNLGRMRLSITTTPGVTADPLPAGVRAILAIPRDRRTPAQAHTVFSYWRTTVAEWKDANAQIEALWVQHPEGSAQLVLQNRMEARETHLLTRGDFLKPAALVTPGVPDFLNPLPTGVEPTRLTFAKWLVDPKTPTTARSIVNRIWQAYFGTGIVATAENFGTQADAPSHPELLDWLSVELMENGWSLKKLQRLIVTSATYRQSSAITPDTYARDPYNVLLARGPRFRVDAEIVRDIQLGASGLLNDKIGGPSVYPPAPDFLFQPPVSYGPKVWFEDKGENRYRRALYTFRYRSVPYPMLQTFDAPNGDSSCVRRSRSNTPLQALTTLNEPLSMEAARALALKTLSEGGKTDAERLAYAFRRCVARRPTEAEANELLGFLEKQIGRIRDGWLDTWSITGAPPKLPAGVTPVQLGAWTALSRVLLNLDETITKE